MSLPSRNIHLREIDTDLLRERLRVMLSTVLSRLSSGIIETEEQFVQEFGEQLADFEAVLVNYYRSVGRVQAGTVALKSKIDDIFVPLRDELLINLGQVEALEALMVSNFNRSTLLGSRVESEVRKLASDLGTYTLYVDDVLSSVNYLSDSFANLERVEFGSSLITSEQCTLNFFEGIATLPEIAGEQTRVKVESFVRNRPSNGLSGNNYDVRRSRNDDPKKIFDDNPDTWFEFERVNAAPVPEPLILDFNLVLESASIVNHIHIVPMNFSERLTPLKIIAIDTSLDGQDWLSVMDEEPIADYKSEDPENVFILSPASARYSPEGYFTFTPRKAKYIHFKFLQEHPYEITTSFGRRYRYAIGLRSIEILGKKYKSLGELVSKSYDLGKQIKKVSLRSAQNPIAPSVLADIKHLVSLDDGATWLELQPQDRGDTGVPEVLEIEDGSTSLRYKAVFERKPEAFKSVAQSEQVVLVDKAETFNFPAFSPHSITVSKVPIVGTIELFDPAYGSVGKLYPKMKLGYGATANEVVLPIPQFIVDQLESKDDVEVYVDNRKWRRIGNYSSTDPWTGGALGVNSRVYYIDADWQIVFGNGLGTAGKIPAPGSIVAITLPEERLHLSGKEPYRATFKFPFDKDRSTISIRRGGAQKTEYSILIPPGVTEFSLGRKDLVEFLDPTSMFFESNPTTGAVSYSASFTTYREFIDGSQEITVAGDFSIDYFRGLVYLATPTSTTNITKCALIHYYDYVELEESEFDFVEGDSQTIEIKHSAYTPTPREKSDVAAGTRVIELEPSVVPGSLVLPTTAFASGNAQEVDFMDGITELSSTIKVTDEAVPVYSGPGVVSFELVHKDKVLPGYIPVFSSMDVFITAKTYVDGSTELVDDGDYSVSLSGGTKGTVYVQLAVGASTGGVVSYHIEDPDISAIRANTYSVDYKEGLVYLGSGFVSGTLTYRTTEYFAKYNIVRQIEKFTWIPGEREITLPDAEVNAYSIDIDLGYKKQLKVRYKANDKIFRTIEELEPYFTPILKDYTLLVVDKDQLLFS